MHDLHASISFSPTVTFTGSLTIKEQRAHDRCSGIDIPVSSNAVSSLRLSLFEVFSSAASSVISIEGIAGTNVEPPA
jgi:hypothetical protein